jgi:hypothetical protein
MGAKYKIQSNFTTIISPKIFSRYTVCHYKITCVCVNGYSILVQNRQRKGRLFDSNMCGCYMGWFQVRFLLPWPSTTHGIGICCLCTNFFKILSLSWMICTICIHLESVSRCIWGKCLSYIVNRWIFHKIYTVQDHLLFRGSNWTLGSRAIRTSHSLLSCLYPGYTSFDASGRACAGPISKNRRCLGVSSYSRTKQLVWMYTYALTLNQLIICLRFLYFFPRLLSFASFVNCFQLLILLHVTFEYISWSWHTRSFRLVISVSVLYNFLHLNEEWLCQPFSFATLPTPLH